MEPIKTMLTNSVVETTWQLSREEIEEIAKTGLIRVRFIGTTIIPLGVSTQSAFSEFEQYLKDNPEFLKAYRNHFGITDNIEKE